MDTSRILVAAEFWSDISADQIDQTRMFQCPRCSDEDTKIFHNLVGQHKHWPASEVRQAVLQMENR